MQSPSQPAPAKGALGIIFFVLLMDVIGLTILIPVAPYIVARYSHEALMVTLLTVIYAAAQFVAAPALGRISDRTGRRPVLLVCVLGSAVGYVIFGLGGALWVLFLSRLIDGVTGGNLSTAMAYIADVSRPEERAKNFVLVGMAYGLGFIAGPAIGGALGQLGLSAPAYAAAILSLASAALIYWRLPESLAPARRETARMAARDFNPLVAIGGMARKPGLGRLLLASALFFVGFDGVNSISALFVARKFAVQPWQIGALFVATGLALAVVQAALVEKLVRRFGERAMALAGLAGSGSGGVLFAAAPAFWLLFPISLLQAGLTGFMWPTLGALTAGRVSEREQGQLAGVNAAVAGLMAAIGPLWAGVVYDHVAPGAPYWIAALLLAGAGVVLLGAEKTAAPQAYREAAAAD
ncbi:MAG: MFS transporter [Anaerolineales bacterium]